MVVDYEVLNNHIYVYFSRRPDKQVIDIIKTLKGYYVPKTKKGPAWVLPNDSTALGYVKSLCPPKSKPVPQPDPLDLLERVEFTYSDVLVRTNTCKVHEHIPYAGMVPVLQDNGTVKYYLIPVFLCKDCQCLFTFEQTFENLKQKGIIACKVVDLSTWRVLKSNSGDFGGRLNPISKLRMHGYCVNKDEDLSDSQRHTILVNLIENGIMSQEEIVGFLDWILRKMGNAGQDAHDKWSQDYDYISRYKIGSLKIVSVQGIYKL